MTPQNPSLLIKAPDGGVSASGAFFGSDDYLDYVDELRRTWQANPVKTNYRAKEWIEMYPELKQDFERLLLEKETEKENLLKEAKERLKNALSVNSEIWRLILVEKIKCNISPKLERLSREIRWFRLGLIEPRETTNRLTEDQIQQARDVPVEELIDTKKINKMWCCPFHEDKTPSFHIYKDNGWHCFGCQAHGHGSIDFLLKLNKNSNFVEVVRYLINK